MPSYVSKRPAHDQHVVKLPSSAPFLYIKYPRGSIQELRATIDDPGVTKLPTLRRDIESC